MTEKLPGSTPELLWLIIGILVSLLVYFLKKKDKDLDDHDKALKENTFALIKLSCQMEIVMKQLEKLPEIEKDLNNVGAKLRSMTGNSNA